MALKPEQVAALASAGYTKAEIEALNPAPPATLEGLQAKVDELTALVTKTQAAAAAAAEAPHTPTAEEILRGFVEEPAPPKV